MALAWNHTIAWSAGRGRRVDGQPSDAELAQAARSDPAAFDLLYRRFLPAVYRYVYVRVGSVADAEDVTSAVFLDVLGSLGNYREQGVFAAWLFTIAQRQVGAHHRRQRREGAHRLALPGDDADVGELVGDEGQARQVARLEQADLLSRAVAGLSDDQREALALRFYGGLKVAEIAKVMGKGESAVKMILHRGLGQLKAGLAGADGEGPR